jgi:hypothetical protein
LFFAQVPFLCAVLLCLSLLASYVLRATNFDSNLCFDDADVGNTENLEALTVDSLPEKDEFKSSSTVSDADSTAQNSKFENSLESGSKGRFKISWMEGPHQRISTLESLVMMLNIFVPVKEIVPTKHSRK